MCGVMALFSEGGEVKADVPDLLVNLTACPRRERFGIT